MGSGFSSAKLQNLVHRLDEMDGHLRQNLRRNVRQIFFIIFRENDRAQAQAVRREQLFLHAADRQHFAAESDLAGHGDVAAHGNAASAR